MPACSSAGRLAALAWNATRTRVRTRTMRRLATMTTSCRSVIGLPDVRDHLADALGQAPVVEIGERDLFAALHIVGEHCLHLLGEGAVVESEALLGVAVHRARVEIDRADRR